MNKRLFWAFGLAAVTAALAACSGEPTPVTPAAVNDASPSPALPEGVLFRETFDGSALDPGVWRAFPQSGLIVVQDGKADLLNTGGQPNFPYMVTRERIIPESGPFYFELAYEVRVLGGGGVYFCLDYEPAEVPGEDALTVPFLRVSDFYRDLRMTVRTEAEELTINAPGGYEVGVPHLLRVENDGGTAYRVLADGQEAATFTSKRRPWRFWVGQYPVADRAAKTWPRLALDSVTAGVLSTPAPAQAPATP